MVGTTTKRCKWCPLRLAYCSELETLHFGQLFVVAMDLKLSMSETLKKS